MHVLNMTPLAREHAEKLAAEDERKRAAALATRRANIRRWQGLGLHVSDLVPAAPTPPRRIPLHGKNAEALKAAKEARLKKLLDHLAKHPHPVKVQDCATALGFQVRVTRYYLTELCHRDLVKAVYGPPSPNGKGQLPRLIGYTLAKDSSPRTPASALA